MEPSGTGKKWILIGIVGLLVIIAIIFFMNGDSMPGEEKRPQLSEEEQMQVKHQVLEQLSAKPGATTETRTQTQTSAGAGTQANTNSAPEPEVDENEAKKMEVLKALRSE